jgi:hypothetical protein
MPAEFDAMLAQKTYDLIAYQVQKCNRVIKETLEVYGYPPSVSEADLLYNTNLPEKATREERVVLYSVLSAHSQMKDSLLFFEEAKNMGDDNTILVMIDTIKKSVKEVVTNCQAMLRAKNAPSFESFVSEQISRILGSAEEKDDHAGPMMLKEPVIH